MGRPSWDEYFMKLAEVAAERSTCLRRQVGAVLVTRNNWVLAIGYCGAPQGLPHCAQLGGCLREKKKIPSGQRHEICRSVHAEQNVIILSAMYGRAIRNSKLYCTHYPCVICAKILVNSGVEQIIYTREYVDEEAKKIFLQAGTVVRRLQL